MLVLIALRRVKTEKSGVPIVGSQQYHYPLSGDYARESVPASARRHWLSLSLIWIGGGIDLAGILLGTQIGLGMSFENAMIATFVGSLILAVVGALTCYVGSETGMSTAMLTRFVFGEYGARIASLIIGITGMGWFGVQTGFFAVSGQMIVKELAGVEVSMPVAALIGGLLMMSTAVIGYKAIEWLSVIAVPIMFGILVGILIVVIPSQSFWEAVHVEPVADTIPLGLGISLVTSLFLVGAIAAPDIGRWARSKKDSILAAVVGFLIGNSLMLVIAVIIAKYTSNAEFIQVMFGIGWGGLAAILFVLGTWTTNDNGLYSTGLALSVALRRWSRPTLVIVAGLIGTALAVFNIYDSFITFLTILSAFVSPIGGVFIAEYYLLNKQRFTMAFLRDNKIPLLYWHSIVVWVLATLVGLSTSPSSEGGFGLFQMTQIPALDAFLAAFLLQWIIGSIVKRNNAKKAEETAESA